MCYNKVDRNKFYSQSNIIRIAWQKQQALQTHEEVWRCNKLAVLNEINEIIDYISDNQNMFRIFGSVLVILVTLAFRKLFVRFVSSVVVKLTRKTKTKLDDHIVDVINPPLYFTFIVIGIWLAVSILDLPPKFDAFMGKVVSSLFAFAVFWAAYRAAGVISSYIEHFAQKTETRIDDMLMPLIRNSIKIIVIVIGVIVIVDQWGYNVAGLLTGLGLGGLAFALAAQDTAANLFGGITIMLDKPFNIGDWILTPQVEGIVEQMGVRSTRIRTFAQALVTVPNSVIINNPITNWSRMGKRRITYTLRLSYDTPPDKLKECIERLRQMLKKHPGIHKDMIFVFFEKFEDSGIELFFYYFTNTIVWKEYLEVREDVNMKVLDIINELGLSIAYPSTNVYLKNKKKDGIVPEGG